MVLSWLGYQLRRRGVLVWSALLGLVLYVLQTSFRHQSFSDIVPSSLLRSSTRPRSCRPSERYRDLAQGRWIPKPYVMTNEKLEEDYGTRWWPCQRDWNPSWKTKPQDDQLKAEMLHRRMLRIASYDWNSTSTVGILPWNGTELIVQALNSERGIVMIGDSLHKQAYDMLLTYLKVPLDGRANEDVFETELDHQGEYPQEFHSATRLKEGTELFNRVRAALPNVPPERLRQPFITLIRNELLLGWDELDLMMRDLGKDDWTPDSGWWLYNGSFTEYLPTERRRNWPGERNSVIFFNTGAHWSAHRLQQTSQDNADKLYSQMVTKMVSRLTSVPKLDIIYRSMTVPHFECWTASAPVYPAIVLDLSQPSATLPWSYGWTSFPKYDQFWATALDQAAPRGQTENGGRVTFLNITEVTGQRIDGHSLCVAYRAKSALTSIAVARISVTVSIGVLQASGQLDIVRSRPQIPAAWLRMFAYAFLDQANKCGS